MHGQLPKSMLPRARVESPALAGMANGRHCMQGVEMA